MANALGLRPPDRRSDRNDDRDLALLGRRGDQSVAPDFDRTHTGQKRAERKVGICRKRLKEGRFGRPSVYDRILHDNCSDTESRLHDRRLRSCEPVPDRPKNNPKAMNTEEIALTTLLIAAIAFMLLRPFVGRRSDAAETRHRHKKNRSSAPNQKARRPSLKTRAGGHRPAIVPAEIRIADPKSFRYKREKSSEALSNR